MRQRKQKRIWVLSVGPGAWHGSEFHSAERGASSIQYETSVWDVLGGRRWVLKDADCLTGSDLHDGRTSDLVQAILETRGTKSEANEVIRQYMRLRVRDA